MNVFVHRFRTQKIYLNLRRFFTICQQKLFHTKRALCFCLRWYIFRIGTAFLMLLLLLSFTCFYFHSVSSLFVTRKANILYVFRLLFPLHRQTNQQNEKLPPVCCASVFFFISYHFVLSYCFIYFTFRYSHRNSIERAYHYVWKEGRKLEISWYFFYEICFKHSVLYLCSVYFMFW